MDEAAKGNGGESDRSHEARATGQTAQPEDVQASGHSTSAAEVSESIETATIEHAEVVEPKKTRRKHKGD